MASLGFASNSSGAKSGKDVFWIDLFKRVNTNSRLKGVETFAFELLLGKYKMTEVWKEYSTVKYIF